MTDTSARALVSITTGISRQIGDRPYQEDNFGIKEELFEKQGIALYGVFDAHGSKEYSKHASKHMLNFITDDEEFKNLPTEKSALKEAYRQLVLRSFLKENEALKGKKCTFCEISGAEVQEYVAQKGGTTATVCIIDARNCLLTLANVGDSRSVIAKKSGSVYYGIRVSKEHHLSDTAEKQRVLEAGGEVRGNRVINELHGINMTRALGDFDFKEPQNNAPGDFISAVPTIVTLELDPSFEFLILASDGLWAEFDDQNIVDIISSLRGKIRGANEICESVVHQVAKKESADNTTMILLQFNWEKDPSAAKNDTDLHQTAVTATSKRNNKDESLTLEGKVATQVAEPVAPDTKKVKITVDNGLDKLRQ